MKRCIKGLIVIVAQSVFVLGSAQAQSDPNLIQNSGFETGTLLNWTMGLPGIVTVETTYNTLGPVVNPNPTDGGSYFAVMAPNGERDTTLSQNPAIPAGFSQPVTLSFAYDLIAKALAAHETAAQQGATLNLNIGGVSVFSETFADAGGPSLSALNASGQTGWETESITLTPTEFDDIQAHGVNLNFVLLETSNQFLDRFDLSAAIDNVELNYTIAPAPDSSSTALLLGGVLSIICFIKGKMA